MEATASDKRSSLLRWGINSDSKTFLLYRDLVILSQNALYLPLTLRRNKLECFVPGNPFQKLKVFRGGCYPYLQHHAIIKKFAGDKHSSLVVLKSF